MITVKKKPNDPDNFTPWGNVGLSVWICPSTKPDPNLVFWGQDGIEVEFFDTNELKYQLCYYGLFETVIIKSPTHNKLTVFLDYD